MVPKLTPANGLEVFPALGPPTAPDNLPMRAPPPWQKPLMDRFDRLAQHVFSRPQLDVTLAAFLVDLNPPPSLTIHRARRALLTLGRLREVDIPSVGAPILAARAEPARNAAVVVGAEQPNAKAPKRRPAIPPA